MLFRNVCVTSKPGFISTKSYYILVRHQSEKSTSIALKTIFYSCDPYTSSGGIRKEDIYMHIIIWMAQSLASISYRLLILVKVFLLLFIMGVFLFSVCFPLPSPCPRKPNFNSMLLYGEGKSMEYTTLKIKKRIQTIIHTISSGTCI